LLHKCHQFEYLYFPNCSYEELWKCENVSSMYWTTFC
jgi:uncharacterized protein with von Willebrand factor type A (vWA) domain